MPYFSITIIIKLISGGKYIVVKIIIKFLKYFLFHNVITSEKNHFNSYRYYFVAEEAQTCVIINV